MYTYVVSALRGWAIWLLVHGVRVNLDGAGVSGEDDGHDGLLAWNGRVGHAAFGAEAGQRIACGSFTFFFTSCFAVTVGNETGDRRRVLVPFEALKPGGLTSPSLCFKEESTR